MIYNKLTVLLLSLLSAEEVDSTNARIARHLLAHAHELGELSIKDLASACHVGAGTISRFARVAGFADFSELKAAFDDSLGSFERVAGRSEAERGLSLAKAVVSSVGQVVHTVDQAALQRLVRDIASYESVWAFGLLKAQAAALNLQVDLLMQGKAIQTCSLVSEQMDRFTRAGARDLIIVFSYTGSYFEAADFAAVARAGDRPKVWVVSGAATPLPPFVSDRLLFSSDLNQLGHPYSLQFVAGLIAQEYAHAAASQG